MTDIQVLTSTQRLFVDVQRFSECYQTMGVRVAFEHEEYVTLLKSLCGIDLWNLSIEEKIVQLNYHRTYCSHIYFYLFYDILNLQLQGVP